MADKQDAALLIQIAQWGTAMGLEQATIALLSDDFNPDTANATDRNVSTVLMFGETLGTLTKNGLLDTALVLDWLWAAGIWSRVAPAALRERERHGMAGLYENFEALAAQQS
ncbi:hypothetical protein [uncultured Jatrophihabitans sp.]|uniref:DUF4760 domain-containing protein n=1 Tax=uncultured Jatrophihabitans sp. TaxID=1610747 RepID=UPI0035CB7CAC